MECNKDEALRAKEISEAKLVEKDFVGAKKFAQKADKLFHGLEGVSHLLVILDVYISSEKKINGEPDWYGVLGVGPTSDDETIRKNYKKLALYLHPDKNKSVGAEGAFKLVSQAWTLLSDKVQKKVYDQSRNPKPVYKPVSVTQKTSASTTKPVYEPVSVTQKTSASTTKPVKPVYKPVSVTQKTSASTTKPVQTIPRPPNTATFWTSCLRCSMRFEYSRVYLNQKIVCPSCHGPFWAIESPAPPMNHHSTTMYPQRQNPKTNHNVNSQQGPSLNTSSVSNVNVQKGPSLNTSAVNRFKNRHQAKVAANDGILKRKRVAEQAATINVGNANAKVNSGGQKVNIDNSRRELSLAETRIMLMTKARKEIHKKMNEWDSESASKKESSGKKYGEEIIVNDTNKVKEVKTPLIDTTCKDEYNDEMDSDVAEAKATLMSVPDPDFHDFDMDRTERSFGENEVWAAYDEDDGMPRYYAMIHNVISKKPFKMQISWLNSKTNAELGPINWVSSGFPKTSGEFRIGKHVINTSLNSFSHKVQWAKGKKGVIQVYPKKGNVWAVYTNWSPSWNEFTPDEVIHKYDMVTVLEDFNEEKGVVVAPLVKVVGFKSVFCQHADVAEARTIPRDEIFRLSHQVPFYLLTGEEAVGVPEGCLELDPAALPLELLQTTIEPEVKTVEDGSCKKTEGNEMITYSRKKGKNGNFISK
ncbi:putative DnaJ domain, Chaperone J-domain superfamily [Helianthus anomalus]